MASLDEPPRAEDPAVASTAAASAETDRGSSPEAAELDSSSASLAASIIAANEEAEIELEEAEAKQKPSPAETLSKEKALGKLEELLSKATAYTAFLEGQMETEKTIKRARTSQPACMTGGKMKDYQLEGLQWLIGLWDNGLNGILADEMGLGKTIQTIALFAHLRDVSCNGWRLLVVPLSTMTNWMQELAKWVPSLPTIQYHGSKEQRADIRKNMAKIKNQNEAAVVVTTYEIVCRDRKELAALRNVHFKHLVVDEGHRLKNHKSRLFSELNMLVGTRAAMDDGCSKILLTGTPLQNNISELWSLLNFLLPNVFDSLGFFKQVFEFDDALAVEREQSIVSKLHRILRPFMLRRLKAQVEQYLPPKMEVVLYVEMTPAQQDLYDGIKRGELKSYLDAAQDKGKSFQMIMMQLRKAANHPWLHFDPTNPSDATTEAIIQASGKFVMLDKLLSRLSANGHKTLIFSQFTKTIDLIDDYLRFLRPEYKYCRLDGSTHFMERRDLMRDFNEQGSDLSIFLLSTRAGGVGINLCAADTVIIFDSDWNPHMDTQAQDRAHRIGQTKPVLVIRFITKSTVEQRIMERANSKRKLERVVCSKHATIASGKTDLSTEELQQLLNDDFTGVDVGVAGDETLDLLASRTRVFSSTLPRKGPGYEVCDWKAASLVGEV